jgi:hypothetical protein
MEAFGSSETLVHIYQTIRNHTAEDRELETINLLKLKLYVSYIRVKCLPCSIRLPGKQVLGRTNRLLSLIRHGPH